MANQIQKVHDKKTLRSLLDKPDVQQSLREMAPKFMTKERIMKMLLVAHSRQPKLYECSQESMLQATMTTAQLGLDCSGVLGQAYLVPFFNGKTKRREMQLIPGYQGLIELARRSGQIARIEARVVYEKDEFEVEYGLEQKLIHKPRLEGERGKMVCVYAIAELRDGSRQLEVMTMDQVEGIRNRSKAKDSGPWVTDYSEMARKTAVRRLFKYLPKSPELEKAMEADSQQYDYDEDLGTDGADATSDNEPSATKRVKAKIKTKQNGKQKPQEQEETQEPDQQQEAGEQEGEEETGQGQVMLCNKCDKRFDYADAKQGGNGAILCPHCLSDDIEPVPNEVKA